MSENATPQTTVVVDVGGTKMLAARADAASGGEVAHTTTPRGGGDELVASVAEFVRSVSTRPLRVVIATPGAIDSSGAVNEAANLSSGPIPLKASLETELGVEVVVIGDVEAGAVAEFGAGAAAASGSRDGIYLTVSTGIGAGLVLDGVLRDHDGVGEFGHIPIAAAQGLECGCGGQGCLETIASGQGISRRAAAMASGSDAIRRLLDSGFELTAREVSSLADAGDAVARRMLDEGTEALAMSLVTLARILAPTTIVVGGGFALGTGLGERLEAAMKPFWRGSRLSLDTRILPAALGRRSVLVGAAMLGDPAHSATPVMPAELASTPWGRSVLGGGRDG